jgi:hypothetical protein
MSRSLGPLPDHDLPIGDVLQSGQHAQRRRLAAAGRADQHQEFLILHFDAQIRNGCEVAKVLVDILISHTRHIALLS